MTQRTPRVLVLAVLAAGTLLSVSSSSAQVFRNKRFFKADLTSYQEVPTLSTPAGGSFRLFVGRDGASASYRLSYSGLETNVRFAHIHFGNVATNGGVSVFLCTNSTPPVGAPPACPQGEGEVTGTFTADDVVGPEAQGIGPGEFAELLAAIDNGSAYVNVHTDAFGSGEIRGQIR